MRLKKMAKIEIRETSRACEEAIPNRSARSRQAALGQKMGNRIVRHGIWLCDEAVERCTWEGLGPANRTVLTCMLYRGEGILLVPMDATTGSCTRSRRWEQDRKF
jgi:hypothetical protein